MTFVISSYKKSDTNKNLAKTNLKRELKRSHIHLSFGTNTNISHKRLRRDHLQQRNRIIFVYNSLNHELQSVQMKRDWLSCFWSLLFRKAYLGINCNKALWQDFTQNQDFSCCAKRADHWLVQLCCLIAKSHVVLMRITVFYNRFCTNN